MVEEFQRQPGQLSRLGLWRHQVRVGAGHTGEHHGSREVSGDLLVLISPFTGITVAQLGDSQDTRNLGELQGELASPPGAVSSPNGAGDHHMRPAPLPGQRREHVAADGDGASGAGQPHRVRRNVHPDTAGQDQQPYLGRWLAISVAFFVASGVAYAARVILRRHS